MSPPRNPLVALQYVLPHRLLSRAACALARCAVNNAEVGARASLA